jgi:hypothetical protein
MDSDDLKLPEGMKFPNDWRPVDIAHAKKLAMLEAKFMSLEKTVNTNAEVLKDLCSYFDKIRKNVVGVDEERILLAEKVQEIYYHIFPDRYEKDCRFENQLRNLARPQKPKDGADPKDA